MRQSIVRLGVLAVALLAGSSAATSAYAADIDAASLWTKNCSVCHGKDAKGNTKAGKEKGVKDLTDPKVRADFKRDKLIKLVKEGAKDEKTGKDTMKAFAGKLDDAQIAALVDYVMALK
jgi:mono/diheme cytochrome c family protein